MWGLIFFLAFSIYLTTSSNSYLSSLLSSNFWVESNHLNPRTFAEIIEINYEWIAENPDVKIQLEGHCDERGTNEYNLALGERRAKAVFEYLVKLGANPSQFTMVSFGEERPVASGSNEVDWAKNRRVEFTRL